MQVLSNFVVVKCKLWFVCLQLQFAIKTIWMKRHLAEIWESSFYVPTKTEPREVVQSNYEVTQVYQFMKTFMKAYGYFHIFLPRLISDELI